MSLLRLIGFREELPLGYQPDSPDSRISDDEEREVELALRNSIRRNAWRAAAGLPLRQNPADVNRWHAFLNYRFWLARYKRRHPLNP